MKVSKLEERLRILLDQHAALMTPEVTYDPHNGIKTQAHELGPGAVLAAEANFLGMDMLVVMGSKFRRKNPELVEELECVADTVARYGRGRQTGSISLPPVAAFGSTSHVKELRGEDLRVYYLQQ